MPPKSKNNIKENVLKKNKSSKNLDENNESDKDDDDEKSEDDDEYDDQNNEDEHIDENNVLSDEENNSESNNEESDNDSESNQSDNSKDDDNNDDNENYIDNEETLSKKCIKKYASMEDDIYLEEIFGDDDNNIIKQDRLTKPFLTKFERVRILATRQKQLAQGAKPMLKNYSGLSSKEIALEELKNKIIPLIIERPVPNVGIEKWKLSELEISF